MTMARVNSSLTVRGSGCSTITHGSAGNTIAEYRYDGLHRRISKAIAGGDTFHYYYNENWQVLEVTKGSAAYEQYVWDARYIDAPVLRWRDANNSEVDGLEETLFYTNDANMNVTALVNESGQVVERYRYDAYGKVTFLAGTKDLAGQPMAEWTVRNASIADNQVLYCGYRFDPETGLYQVRHRMLHPTAGRWMQRDPEGYVDGMGLYEYVMSSPTRCSDHSGAGPTGPSTTTAPVRFQLPGEFSKLEDEYGKTGSTDNVKVLVRRGWNPHWPATPEERNERNLGNEYAKTYMFSTILNPDLLKGKCCLTACILAGELQHVQKTKRGHDVIFAKYKLLKATKVRNDWMRDSESWFEVDAATVAINCLETAKRDRAVGKIRCNESAEEIQAVIEGLENFRKEHEKRIGQKKRPDPASY